MIFYDGHCGLCHRVVRFVIAEDREGDRFRFAPLDGETFQNLVGEIDPSTLPDSLVVRTTDGRLLTRSAAVLHILRRLGGAWKLGAHVFGIVPAPLRDGAYDLIARVRHRLFKRPVEACPIVPPHLRTRFDP